MELITYWGLYAAIGLTAGVVAGLLGVGGGVVVVPALVFAYTIHGMPPEFIMHLALGTSLAIIIFTSMSSVYAHHKKGAVIWSIVFSIAPGILVGTYAGTWVAALLSTKFLGVFFSVFLFLVAIQMMLSFKPKASRHIPGFAAIFGVGGIIGGVSSLVGIGGGTMSVPFMIWCNTPPHKAVATSAGIGFPIAVAGAAGYVVNGWGLAGLPAHTLGFVHLPSLLGVAVGTVLTAPFGAWLAHKLPADRLKKVFAVFMLFVAVRMLLKMI